MKRPALNLAVLAMVAALVATAPAVAKLPPGTAFEACGASGCHTEKGAKAQQGWHLLLEPTIEHGDAGAPHGNAAWFRVNISFPANPGKPWTRRALRPVENKFPVVFAAGVDLLGVPRKSGAYRWVPMRPIAIEAYSHRVERLEPFPAQDLGKLDREAVVRAAEEAAFAGDEDVGINGAYIAAAVFLAVVLGVAGLAVARGLSSARVRRSSHGRASRPSP